MGTTINAEMLIKNFKKLNDVEELKSCLFDISLMAQEANPTEFKECDHREKIKNIYGLLSALQNIEI